MSVQPRERTNLAIMYKIVLVLPTSRQYCHVTTQGRYMHFNLSDFVGARRGSVVTPSICADCQHNYCPIGFPETLSNETLGGTFYSVQRPDRSPIPTVNRRGHPLDPVAPRLKSLCCKQE